jgi:hypothetical protein
MGNAIKSKAINELSSTKINMNNNQSTLGNDISQLSSEILFLVEAVKVRQGAARAESLRKLWDAAEKEENKLPLANPELGLVQFLVGHLETEADDCLRNALGCIWFLSRAIPNREYFGRKETNIVQNLMRINHSNHHVSNFCFLIFVNIGLHPATHSYVFSDEVGLIEFYRNYISRNPTQHEGYRLFGNYLSAVSEEHVGQFLKWDIHGILINRMLEGGSNPNEWIPRRGGIEYWCLNGLMGLSTTKTGAKAIYDFGIENFLLELTAKSINHVESVKSASILCNIYVNVDNTSDSSLLLLKQPGLFLLALDVLLCTVRANDCREAETLRFYGYTFGVITLPILTNFIKNLSLINCEENNALMLQYDPDKLIEQIDALLTLFVEDRPEISTVYDYKVYAGGGGKDYETVQNLLELLLQFSLYLRKDGDDQKYETKVSGGKRSFSLFQWKTVLKKRDLREKFRSSVIPQLIGRILVLPEEEMIPARIRSLSKLLFEVF